MNSAKPLFAATLIMIASTYYMGGFAAPFKSAVTPSLEGSTINPPYPSTQNESHQSMHDTIRLCGFQLLLTVRELCFPSFSRGAMSEIVTSLIGISPEEARDNYFSRAEDGPEHYSNEDSDYATSEDSDLDQNLPPEPSDLEGLGDEEDNNKVHRGNLHDECCKNRCTVTHLLDYCEFIFYS